MTIGRVIWCEECKIYTDADKACPKCKAEPTQLGTPWELEMLNLLYNISLAGKP